MADVRAFRGIRYDAAKTGDLSLVVSPPYDVIDSDLQEELYRKSEYGIVRVDFGKVFDSDDDEDNRYSRARELYREWLKSDVLIQDALPSIYYVEEDYAGEFGGVVTRSGFMAAVRVKDAESGVYRPHEKTLAGPKADRLELTRACKANLSPVFSLYDDPESLIDGALAEWKSAAGEPDERVRRPDGYEIRMWDVTDESVIALIHKVMEPKSFYIADGHHRYETALNYKNEMRAANPDFTTQEPWNFTLMYLVNMHSPGLTVLPTHRAVFGLDDFSGLAFLESLAEKFDVTEFEGSVDDLMAAMKNSRGKEQVIGLLLRDHCSRYLVRPKAGFDREVEMPHKTPALRVLDVVLLHSMIIKRVLGIDDKAQEDQTNLAYVKDAHDLAAMVDEGHADIGFILNPTPVTSVKNAAEAGERMPQKSTFFYPKLVTGLVINPLE